MAAIPSGLACFETGGWFQYWPSLKSGQDILLASYNLKTVTYCYKGSNDTIACVILYGEIIRLYTIMHWIGLDWTTRIEGSALY